MQETPFESELRYLKTKADLLDDEPVLQAHVLEQIKHLHSRYDEKITEKTRIYIQKKVDNMFKNIPSMIRKLKAKR